MRKILFVLCILILLAACGPKTGNEITGLVTLDNYDSEDTSEKIVEEKTETIEDKTIVVEKTIEDEPEEISETANFKEEIKVAIEEVKDSVVNPTVRNLLTKLKDIKSYAFLYGGPETANLFLDNFYCLGSDCSKMVISFYDGEEYVKEGYYDNAYISDDDAVGCCLDMMRCYSNNVDNRDKVFNLDKKELFIPRTPVEWLEFFGNMDAEYIGKSAFDNRMVEDFFFEDKEFKYTVKLDERYGVPHLIIKTKGEEKIAKYQFNDFVFNSHKSDDFVAPCTVPQE